MSDKPVILFVCVHNAGRSQMAAGYMRSLSAGAVNVFSGGSEPGESINQVAVQAMAEDAVDITGTVPQLLRTEQVKDADVVITMGCGDACPIFPGKRYEDWELTDPAGLPLEQVRLIRDDIKSRIHTLLTEILPAAS
jgi:arsenate reductase